MILSGEFPEGTFYVLWRCRFVYTQNFVIIDEIHGLGGELIVYGKMGKWFKSSKVQGLKFHGH